MAEGYPPAAPHERRIPLGTDLRSAAARGTLINASFTIALSLLALLRGFILAGLLSRSAYGLWGIIVTSLSSIVLLKQAGIGDRFIQQDELDQEAAFQVAFTLELILTLICVAVMLAVVPLLVLVYGMTSLILPSVVVALSLILTIFHAPLWIPYRRMQYARQRVLQAIDPVVGFAAAIALAAAGAGVWAFIGAALAGWGALAVAAVATSPYRLRWRLERRRLRDYRSFSGPLLAASLSGLVIAWSAVLGAKLALGVAAVGVIALADNIAAFTERVDDVLTGTLYPAICAVRDRPAVMYESLVKSNRVALIWAVPLGLAIALFAADLVRFGIGERWHAAIIVLQIFGVVAAVNHVGFNWTAYLRAIGRTRPIAVTSFAAAATFLVIGLPLLLWQGLTGFAIAIALQALAALILRAYYLQQIFPGFDFLRQAARAFLPTLPAAALVLLLRAAEPGHRTLLIAAAELAAYVAVCAALTWLTEGALLREAIRYLNRSRLAAG